MADPGDFATSYGYDAEGNTTSVTDPLGHQSTTTYDPLGNQLTSTDPRGHTTTWTYDAASRIATVTPPGGADPTSYDYDNYGDLTTRTDALTHETIYTYNDLHQVTSVTDPLGRTKTLDYDADGHPTTTITARGNALGADPEDWTITQDFDPSGRLLTRATADPADSASYTYDADGLMTGYTDAHGTTQGYNDAGQLTEVTQPDETTFEYNYNTTGSIASRTYPNGDATTYTYNDDGLAATQTTDSQTTSYGYNPDRQLTQIAYPATDIVENREYDPAGQISDITTLDTSGPTVIDEYTYVRDANGNPSRITQTIGTTATPRAFTYNDLNWLTTECPGATTCTGATNYVAYGYDDVGNRLQMDRVGALPNPGTTDYTYDNADELTSTDDGTLTNYTYDTDGNLTSGGRTWNALNQMTGSNVTGASAITYGYDALGNRIASTTASETTGLSWDVNNPLPMLSVTTNSDDEHMAYSYTPTGDLLQTQHPDQLYPRSFHSTDALGSVTDTFINAGTPEVRTTYDAYGNPSVTSLVSGAVLPDLGYTGAIVDATTGDNHLRARDYASENGRFTSADPLAPALNSSYISRYTYANNNPTLNTDPTGKIAKPPPREEGGCVYQADPNDPTQAVAQTEASLELAQCLSNSRPPTNPLVTIADGIVYNANECFTDTNSSFSHIVKQHVACINTALVICSLGLIGAAPEVAVGAGAGAGAEAGAEAGVYRVVIGGMEDLGAGSIGNGERTLLPQLEGDLGSVEANWARNEQVLLNEMSRGIPIRDASVDSVGNLRLEGSGRFITRERELLRAHGWTYNPATTSWSP